MPIREGYHLQLECDLPDCTKSGDFSGSIDARGGGRYEVRKEAKRRGWAFTFRPKEKVLCPEHNSSNYTRENNG